MHVDTEVCQVYCSFGRVMFTMRLKTEGSTEVLYQTGSQSKYLSLQNHEPGKGVDALIGGAKIALAERTD